MYNPVKVHFGKEVVDGLGKSVKNCGRRVMLVYGGGSIRKYGIYQDVMDQLSKVGLEVVEYSGIHPNPRIEEVDEAARLGRDKEVDVIVAVGGGSVIDAAKIISITIPVMHSGWEFVKGEKKPAEAVPLIAVLTLAATGTEMNRAAVVQNNQTNEKLGFVHRLLYPKESFLDPSYTLSVPKNYTGYGIVDLTAHCLESYFGEGEASLSDRFVYSIIHEAMKYGPLLMDDLKNYDLRARIMYAATSALNNLTSYGRKNGDWAVHGIGHVLSVLYDVPHGASLSIGFPAWLKLMKDRIPERISELSENLFGNADPEKGIFELETFFSSVESPIRLSDIGIDRNMHLEILETLVSNKVTGNHLPLDQEDYKRLLLYMA